MTGTRREVKSPFTKEEREGVFVTREESRLRRKDLNNDKKNKFRSHATHTDEFGNLYKFVNNKLFKYTEISYIYSMGSYPVYTSVDENKQIDLFEIDK